jgi:hypothetical protein
MTTVEALTGLHLLLLHHKMQVVCTYTAVKFYTPSLIYG